MNTIKTIITTLGYTLLAIGGAHVLRGLLEEAWRQDAPPYIYLFILIVAASWIGFVIGKAAGLIDETTTTNGGG